MMDDGEEKMRKQKRKKKSLEKPETNNGSRPESKRMGRPRVRNNRIKRHL